MTPSELKHSLADICAIPLTPALSDDTLSALICIYVSVYNMIAGDGTDDEYSAPIGGTRLWLLSVLTDRACRQASSALQEEYFAHSA